MLPHVFAVHNNGETPEKVFLSGTPAFPIQILSSLYDTVVLGWRFQTNGVIMPLRDGDVPLESTVWNNKTPPRKDYWIKFTTNTQGVGQAPPDSNDAINWSALTTARSVTWTANTGVPLQGSVKVEIAADSAGQEILATGYYGIYSEGGL